jgi:hypothetical protein
MPASIALDGNVEAAIELAFDVRTLKRVLMGELA